MPNCITQTEYDILKRALRSIESYLNFVDEAEDRSNGLVSVHEYDLQVWSASLNSLIADLDLRRNERLEAGALPWRRLHHLRHGACRHALQGDPYGDAANGHFLVG